MFSTLDSIDWKGLGYHVYSRHEGIPQAIRNLLSPDRAERESARSFLLGEGQDFGDIYDTTPRIIPFCLEVLALEGAPNKAELMNQLSGQGRYIAESKIRSVHMMDLCLQTYAALQAGLDLYLDLLARGDHDERMAACELLQYMTDDSERLIPALLERFAQEADEPAQLSMLYCLKQLLGSLEWPHFTLGKQYAPALRSIVEGHPSQSVRVAAARASVELVRTWWPRENDLLSPQVTELLAREFLQPGPPMHWTEDYPSLHQENLVHDLARLPDPEPMLRLLADPGITPEQAHLLARGLLCQAFINPEYQRSHWQQMARYEKRKEGDYYLREHTIASYRLERRKVRTALKVIVAADRVWERPTNLFSYFYGLPDSRDGLRALVEDQGV